MLYLLKKICSVTLKVFKYTMRDVTILKNNLMNIIKLEEKNKVKLINYVVHKDSTSKKIHCYTTF